MIVGPYEETFLLAAIYSCEDLVDEVVIVDTAPENNPNSFLINMLKVRYNQLLNKPFLIIDMPRGEDKDFSFAAARELARVNTESEWVLRLDSDEVLHEKDIEELKKLTEDERYSAIEVAFYHLMVYPWLYQYIEPKQILFRKDKFSWNRGVHELPSVQGRVLRRHDIKYIHYGYCRGEAEVFKRWVLYTDIDGRPNYYDGVDPNTILQDRISVCQNFPKELHPVAVHSTLDRLFPLWREEP